MIVKHKYEFSFLALNILLLMTVENAFCQYFSKSLNIKYIQFVPKEFHEIKLGYYEQMPNVCTPLGGADPLYTYGTNVIFINIPKKIICKDEAKPIIPVCGAYIVTDRRQLKYIHLSDQMLNIRRIDDAVWYSTEITDLDPSIVIPSFISKKEQKAREKEIQEAQKYSDEELDADTDSGGGWLNVDLMEYVGIPLTSGVYEIYVSFSGLKSNHERVEIVIEDDVKVQDN